MASCKWCLETKCPPGRAVGPEVGGGVAEEWHHMRLGTLSVVTEDGPTYGDSATLWLPAMLITTSCHFLSTCSVLGTVLDIEGGFKRDKRHSSILQATCNLIWELKPTQMMQRKNGNKHFFSKCKMAWGSPKVWVLRGWWITDSQEGSG